VGPRRAAIKGIAGERFAAGATSEEQLVKHNKVPRAAIVALVIVIIVVAMALTTKYQPTGPGAPTQSVSGQGLDPQTWAQQNYDSKVVPAINTKAQPWGQLITAIQANEDAAGKQYGAIEQGSNFYAFATTITGTLATSTYFGELAIQSPDTPTGVTVGFQVGPAVTGSALRDASGLLDFGMFINQTAYQQAADALNNMVKTEVLASFDSASAVGKSYTITGAFSWDGSGHVTITPVSITAAS